jgi:hypothetical protein
MAARREGRLTKKAGVPQHDPADIAARSPEVPPVIEEPVSETSHDSGGEKAKSDASVDQGGQDQPRSTVIQDPRLLPVDKTAALVPLSTYVYPDRKRQLKQEAISTGKDMYEILDKMAEEYFDRHYAQH